MENQIIENKKRNTKLYVVIAILSVLVLALVGYIVYDKTQNEKNDSQNDVSNININEFQIDDTKELVYDAEYEKNVIADSYSTRFNTYYSKDIVVPFINIDSTYANDSNNEIKSVFEDAIKNYNNGVNDKMTYVDECGYIKYINDDSLSVILTYGVGATDVVRPDYYTYNINLNTGEQLSYQEAYRAAGFNSASIDSKVESAITVVMQEKMSGFSHDDFVTYNNQSINNYKNSVNDNTLRYFLSDNGRLNVIVKLIIPIGAGQFDTIITID